MKRVLCIWFVLACVVGQVYSQTNKNLYRRVLDSFNTNEIVSQIYKIGPLFRNSVFVIRNTETRQDRVCVYGRFNSKYYDSIISLDDDGYVYSSEGVCYYSRYNQNQGKQIADSRRYKLVRDQYMPQTVLVVNDVPYELFGVYNEDNFRFKFSYNGEHWMAVGKDCFWVDGVLKSVQGYKITDFLISDSGYYVFKAYNKENYGKGEVIMCDGRLIICNADVRYFGMNANRDLKFRFVSGDRYLQYENGKVADVTAEMSSMYYPEEEKDKLVRVYSNDGKHVLTYNHGVPSVEIDGVKMVNSEPYCAYYDWQNNAFVWNAIETQNRKTELVVYRYDFSDNY